MRLKNLTFAVLSVLGCLQSSASFADAQTDVLYPFVTTYPLVLGVGPDEDQKSASQMFLFQPYLMIVDGNNPVVPSTLFDRTHAIVNTKFKNLFHGIDGYFGGGHDAEPSDKLSWARLRVDTIKNGAEGTEVKASIKLRVVLPRAEKRLSLLFSTDDDQNAGTPAPQGGRAGEPENDGFSLALRFIRQARDSGTFNFDLGARYRDRKAQIFGRVNMFYAHDLKWDFHSRFSNSFYYFSASGYDNKFRYDLTRPIKGFDSLLFRGSTELAWREGRRGTLISETVGLYSDIDDNRTVAVEALRYYTTVLNDNQTDKLLGTELRVRFRHNVWRRWFFYEVWPTISWEPVNDYQASFGGMFRVEMYVGKF